MQNVRSPMMAKNWGFPKITRNMKLKFDKKITRINSFPKPTLKEKCEDWNHAIISSIAVIIFLIILGIASYHLYESNGCFDNRARDFRNYKFKSKCTASVCNIDCDNIDEEKVSVAEHINAIIPKDCTIIKMLSITNTKFNQSELNNGWLKNIKPKIDKLKIEKCTLLKINKRAFADHPFNKLVLLRIVDVDVTTLTRHSFLGLNALSDFAFCKYAYFQKLRIEKNALEGMKQLVGVMELSGFELSPQDIINLTGGGGSRLSQLKILVLSYNKIPELAEYSFKNAPHMEQLHLQSSNLEKIHFKTFWGENTIKSLNLKGNYLETLPAEAFSDLKRLNKGGINLSANSWKCNCSLQWLKDYYLGKNYVDTVNPPLCVQEHGGDKKFEEVEFCPNDSTSTPTFLPTSSTPPTTQIYPIERFIKIPCTNPRTFHNNDIDARKTHMVEVIIIKNESVKLEFDELEDLDPLRVVLKTNEDLRAYNLLWFNAQNKSESNCVKSVQNNIVINNLRKGTNYGFSLMLENNSEVSPASTFCLKTEPEWNLRPWIINKYKILIITFLAVFLTIIVFLAVCLTFICIRSHPKLVRKKNKSVILMKPKNLAEEQIVCRTERPVYWEPSIVPSTNGYLTPTYNRYAKVRYRPPLMRSISEYTVTDTHYSNPRDRMLGHDGCKGTSAAETYEEFPPPLPPPNPTPKRPQLAKITVEEENVYDSL